MKFKVAFTISPEALFGMLAKFLPVEDLAVEEVPDRAPPTAAQTQARSLPPTQRLQVKPTKTHRRPRKNPGPDLKAGANAAILMVLGDGAPHSPNDMKRELTKRGYSPNSVGSRLERLRAHGILHRPAIGEYQLTAKGRGAVGLPAQEATHHDVDAAA